MGMGRQRKPWVGRVFDRWTVIADDRPPTKILGTGKREKRMVLARCECGLEKYVSISSLDGGGTKQCAACAEVPTPERLASVARNITGERFGTYVVLGDSSTNRGLGRKVTARCGCGRERVMTAKEFLGAQGPRQRCITCSNMHRRHLPDEAWELKQIHDQMVVRCTDPRSANWITYGGRGIRVCDEWRGVGGLLRFAAYVVSTIGRRPSKAHTLDRINGRIGYEPGNIRWSTPKEQAANRRKPMPFQPRGLTRQLIHAELVRLRADCILLSRPVQKPVLTEPTN